MIKEFLSQLFCAHVWQEKIFNWDRLDLEMYGGSGKRPYVCRKCGKRIHSRELPVSFVV